MQITLEINETLLSQLLVKHLKSGSVQTFDRFIEKTLNSAINEHQDHPRKTKEELETIADQALLGLTVPVGQTFILKDILAAHIVDFLHPSDMKILGRIFSAMCAGTKVKRVGVTVQNTAVYVLTSDAPEGKGDYPSNDYCA